ncbi:MAG: hypothetical protein ACLRIO_04780 [Butyricicoccus sp.]
MMVRMQVTVRMSVARNTGCQRFNRVETEPWAAPCGDSKLTVFLATNKADDEQVSAMAHQMLMVLIQAA